MGRPRPSRAALPGPQQACVGRRKAHTRPKTEVAEGSRRTYIVRLRSPNGRSFAFPIPSLQFLSLSLSLSLFLSSSPERRYEFAVGKQKNEGGEGAKRGGGGGGGGGGKAGEQKDGRVAVVLKIDLHCGGCQAKIEKFLKKFPGVEKTKVDGGAMKVTVEGDVDPAKLREKMQEKTKKKVELVSPLSKREKGQSGDEKKKADEEKKKPKEPPVTTVVLKFSCLHCEGCIQRIRKIITKTKGVLDVGFNRDKDTATVRGAMDAKALAENLREQMKRVVEIVPPKKDKDGGEAKDKEGSGGKNRNVSGG